MLDLLSFILFELEEHAKNDMTYLLINVHI